MLRISKLSDYALIILTEMNENDIFSAKTLSDKNSIPFATTNKILKLLVNSKICISKKGKNGGFSLNKSLNKISILEVIYAIDDKKPSLTECSTSYSQCQLKNYCKISSKMNVINKEICNILSKKFLSDLIT
jgi:FeS assembly SUF system regulator